MTNIDYKAEVLKIYDDAIDVFMVWGFYIIIDDLIISKLSSTESEAWQSAYENLKKEGRII